MGWVSGRDDEGWLVRSLMGHCFVTVLVFDIRIALTSWNSVLLLTQISDVVSVSTLSVSNRFIVYTQEISVSEFDRVSAGVYNNL